MSATVMHNPDLQFESDPDGTPALVDLCPYTLAVELSSDTETIDIGTYCSPSASEVGRTTEECTVTFLWEPALVTALTPLLGQEIEVQLKPDKDVTEMVHFRGRFTSLPWGRFEVGQRIEVDLSVAVLTPLAYGTPA